MQNHIVCAVGVSKVPRPPKIDTRRIDHIMSLHIKFQPSKSKNTSFISKKRVVDVSNVPRPQNQYTKN